MLGAVDQPVEKLELLGHQPLHHEPAYPLEGSAGLDQPRRQPQVVGPGFAVRQPAGVLVHPHQQQRRFLRGRMDAAIAVHLRHDRAGSAQWAADDVGGAEPVVLVDVVVDEGDRALVPPNQVPHLAQPRRVAGVHHHHVLEPFAARQPQPRLGVGDRHVVEEPSHRGLGRARQQHHVAREQARGADRGRERVEVRRQVGGDDLHGFIVGRGETDGVHGSRSDGMEAGLPLTARASPANRSTCDDPECALRLPLTTHTGTDTDTDTGTGGSGYARTWRQQWGSTPTVAAIDGWSWCSGWSSPAPS